MDEDTLYSLVEDDQVTLEDFKKYLIPNEPENQDVGNDHKEILEPANQSLTCSRCFEIFATSFLLQTHHAIPPSFCAVCHVQCCGPSHLNKHTQECYKEKRRMETLAMLALECRQVMVDNKEALEERLDAINMETEGMRDTKEIESGEEQEDGPGVKTEGQIGAKSERRVKILSCGFGCGKAFKDKASLGNHRSNAHPELEQFMPVELLSGQTACPVCDKEFKLKNTCSVHIKVKHLGWSPQNPFYNKCQQCDKTFTGPKMLKSHEETIHKGNKSVCKICFSRVASLSHHMSSVHVQAILACQVCGKSFKRIADLKRHRNLVHLKVRNHACDICGKRFGEKKDMTRHKDCVHFGKKLPWSAAFKKEEPQRMVQMVLEDGSTVVIPMEYVEQNQVKEEEMLVNEMRVESVVANERYQQVKEEEAIKVFVMDS